MKNGDICLKFKGGPGKVKGIVTCTKLLLRLKVTQFFMLGIRMFFTLLSFFYVFGQDVFGDVYM